MKDRMYLRNALWATIGGISGVFFTLFVVVGTLALYDARGLVARFDRPLYKATCIMIPKRGG